MPKAAGETVVELPREIAALFYEAQAKKLAEWHADPLILKDSIGMISRAGIVDEVTLHATTLAGRRLTYSIRLQWPNP